MYTEPSAPSPKGLRCKGNSKTLLPHHEDQSNPSPPTKRKKPLRRRPPKGTRTERGHRDPKARGGAELEKRRVAEGGRRTRHQCHGGAAHIKYKILEAGCRPTRPIERERCCTFKGIDCVWICLWHDRSKGGGLMGLVNTKGIDCLKYSTFERGPVQPIFKCSGQQANVCMEVSK